ncbi:patatin-like phospholipase family protein [Agromyces mangrovi Wang et al. 2018]|uniref:patatin-like phospholipase family protein n=1 Tax=Agromyces mangrovi TaxID=1858653 RepID=UPI003306653E
MLASASLPGVFRPVRIGDEHFVDGGLVNSIPVGEAVSHGATDIMVLQVGRIEHPLSAPQSHLGTARIAFEISRRHRFARDSATLPKGVRMHVLPTGTTSSRDNRVVKHLSIAALQRRIDNGYEASVAYLDEQAKLGTLPGRRG